MALKPEQKDQIELFNWIRENPLIADIAFHVPNGCNMPLYFAAILKKMGLLKGVSDIFSPLPRDKYHGLFIELKSKGKNGAWNKPTPSQIKFMKSVTDNGYKGEFCFGVDMAREVIENYMSIG